MEIAQLESNREKTQWRTVGFWVGTLSYLPTIYLSQGNFYLLYSRCGTPAYGHFVYSLMWCSLMLVFAIVAYCKKSDNSSRFMANAAITLFFSIFAYWISEFYFLHILPKILT